MRIFLSGVSRTFASHREAVATRLRQLGFDPVQQKEFTATFEKITDLLRKEIKSCDAVLCLVGPAYGYAPRQQTADPPRSYTQIEYDVARQLKKAIYVFTPSASCPVDGAPQDSAEQLAWQQRFRDDLRAADHLTKDYGNLDRLLGLVDELVHQTADAALRSTVLTHYPTPLAQLYGECFPDGAERFDAECWEHLVAETLRLLALVAMADATGHGIFGAGRVDAPALVAQAVGASDGITPEQWIGLARLATVAPDLGSRRFVEQLQGWEAKHQELLAAVGKAQGVLASRRPRAEKNEARSILQAQAVPLSKAVDFLMRYALIGIASLAHDKASCRAVLLRGEHPQPLELTLACDRGPAPGVQASGVYLLSLDSGKALALAPALRFDSARLATDVYGIAALQIEDGGGCIEYESFVEHERLSVPAVDDADATPQIAVDLAAQWLGPEFATTVLKAEAPLAEASKVERLFDDASWRLIQEQCLPGELEAPVIAGRRLEGTPFYRGLHADLYETTGPDDAPGEPATVAVIHVLRQDGVQDAHVRRWFEARCQAWRQVTHPAVVRLHAESEAAPDAAAPFLLAELVPEATTLEAELQRCGAVADDRCLAILTLAAEVCRDAHAAGVYLMALPPRHFILGPDGRVALTGFEAAVAAAGLPLAQMPAAEYFSKFTRHRNLIDPQVLTGRMRPGPLADVYALGTLLATLRGLPVQPLERLPCADWRDPWRCLAFHCLAARPSLRFQSVEHFARALIEWPRSKPGQAPETVVVSPGSLTSLVGDAACVAVNSQPATQAASPTAFRIAKYPVTNAEYAAFCADRGARLPCYLHDGDEEQHRLAGPWCPVTHVCLDHAQSYCQWLSQRTRQRWRLPTEREWRRAALLDGAGPYPWGSAAPTVRHANFDRTFAGPTVVGAFPDGRSAAGCYDMAGNVWEWCEDFIDEREPLRVLKGGAYDFDAESLKADRSHGVLCLYRSAHAGFRVLCEES